MYWLRPGDTRRSRSCDPVTSLEFFDAAGVTVRMTRRA
jgi:hypothetical protein